MEAGKNIRISQLLAISIVAAAVLIIISRRVRSKLPKYADSIVSKAPLIVSVGVENPINP